MKIYGAIAFAAFAVLATFAVWFGTLNQDEGWYVYASSLVADGKIPYRDFFYTQGPLMPFVYSAFAPLWKSGGILAARIVTCAIGFLGIMANVLLARTLVEDGSKKSFAGLAAFMLLACNLYHVYYNAIPKTYALAGLFVSSGILLAVRAAKRPSGFFRNALFFASGVLLAFAAGVRISLGAAAVAAVLVAAISPSCAKRDVFYLAAGVAVGFSFVYLPFILDPRSLPGLLAAQKYHAARKGFSLFFTAGSFSRLVRWYLPIFILAGLNWKTLFPRSDAARSMVFWPFAAVFAVQMAAPFPYEDYQVPVAGLLAAIVASMESVRVEAGGVSPAGRLLLPLGLSFACSFGSPLLEKWTLDGQDRMWPLKKDASELAVLRETAREIEEMDPGGKTLLTQDLYLAVETGRKVPEGLEMGPFSMMPFDDWCEFLSKTDCPVAALSGYTFAIDPPSCEQRPFEEQLLFWSILKSRYVPVRKVEHFGQNSTPLLILSRKP